jgi:hypothetical protein
VGAIAGIGAVLTAPAPESRWYRRLDDLTDCPASATRQDDYPSMEESAGRERASARGGNIAGKESRVRAEKGFEPHGSNCSPEIK